MLSLPDGRRKTIHQAATFRSRFAELVGPLVVDAAAVVGALVPIIVALIGAAESEEVIALQHSDVVAEEVIVAIPEPRANVLSVDVVRSEYSGSVFAERLERRTPNVSTKLRELRYAARIRP